jgi:signal transduction histidine kinase
LHPVPAAQADFAGALSTLLAEWSERFGIPVHCAVAREVAEQLPGNIAATLVAITEEALHNVIKHARATSVNVSFSCGDDHAVLLIEDDGRGFDLRQDVGSDSGIGLTTMRERAELASGELAIESSLNRGTTISVRLPLTAELEPDRREPA